MGLLLLMSCTLVVIHFLSVPSKRDLVKLLSKKRKASSNDDAILSLLQQFPLAVPALLCTHSFCACVPARFTRAIDRRGNPPPAATINVPYGLSIVAFGNENCTDGHLARRS